MRSRIVLIPALLLILLTANFSSCSKPVASPSVSVKKQHTIIFRRPSGFRPYYIGQVYMANDVVVMEPCCDTCGSGAGVGGGAGMNDTCVVNNTSIHRLVAGWTQVHYDSWTGQGTPGTIDLPAGSMPAGPLTAPGQSASIPPNVDGYISPRDAGTEMYTTSSSVSSGPITFTNAGHTMVVSMMP